LPEGWPELAHVVGRLLLRQADGKAINRESVRQAFKQWRIEAPMVPVERIELPTFGLQNRRCNTSKGNTSFQTP
jgi:hypothetical protein